MDFQRERTKFSLNNTKSINRMKFIELLGKKFVKKNLS